MILQYVKSKFFLDLGNVLSLMKCFQIVTGKHPVHFSTIHKEPQLSQFFDCLSFQVPNLVCENSFLAVSYIIFDILLFRNQMVAGLGN